MVERRRREHWDAFSGDPDRGVYRRIDLSRQRLAPEDITSWAGSRDTIAILNANQVVSFRDILIRFNDPEGEPLPLARVLDMETAPFERLYLQNDAHPGAVLELILGGDLATKVRPTEQGSTVVTGDVDVIDRPARELGRVSPAEGAAFDVSDRPARELGQADVTDRPARELGRVSPAEGAAFDVSDRAARELGQADVTDRPARELGRVSPAAGAAFDVSDRAARELGQADVTDRPTRELGRLRPYHDRTSWAGQVTTDAWADLGEPWSKPDLVSATLVVSNTGVNGAQVRVMGSVDGGVTFDVELQPEATVAAGDRLVVEVLTYVTDLLIQVQAEVAGNQTTVSAKAAAVSV